MQKLTAVQVEKVSRGKSTNYKF